MPNYFNPSVKFLDPAKILFGSGLSAGQIFADFGAGSGFYSLAAGKLVGERGMVYSADILDTALDHIAAEGRLKGLRNIKPLHCDLEQSGACALVPTGTVDLVLFANIVHQIQNRKNLFEEAYRLLRTGGKLLVIDWNDQPSPIGPPALERVALAEISKLAIQTAFKPAGNVSADQYHYGLMFVK